LVVLVQKLGQLIKALELKTMFKVGENMEKRNVLIEEFKDGKNYIARVALNSFISFFVPNGQSIENFDGWYNCFEYPRDIDKTEYDKIIRLPIADDETTKRVLENIDKNV